MNLEIAMRNEIYSITGNAEDRIENLEQRIANNPNNEDNHLNLFTDIAKQVIKRMHIKQLKIY